MKVLYLTVFESPAGNGVYETQVQQVLCALSRKYRDQLTLTHLALLPAIVVGRRGVSRESMFSARFETLIRAYSADGVRARVVFMPLIVTKRGLTGLRLPVLAAALLSSFPVVVRQLLRFEPDVIHCRSYVATALALASRAVRRDVRVVFDPRGFYPEEGVVTGRWSEDSLTFRMWKRIERSLCEKSSAVVALSEPFAERIRSIESRSRVEVIPAATALDAYRRVAESRDAVRRQLAVGQRTVFVYSGGLGSWHDPELLVQLFTVIKSAVAPAKLLVLTSFSRERLVSILTRHGLSEDDYLIHCAQQAEVPRYLVASDFGLVPSTRSHEGLASTVVAGTMIGTKVAEYFAAGLPIVANENVGGLRTLMQTRRLGVTFKTDDLAALSGDLLRMISSGSTFRQECLRVAEQHFSLDRVSDSYFELYGSLQRSPGDR